MLAIERRELILNQLRQNRCVLVGELSRIFGQLKDDSLEESLQAMRTINRILERFPSGAAEEKEEKEEKEV